MRRHHRTTAAVLRSHREGYTLRAIARHYGLTRREVSRMLYQGGVPLLVIETRERIEPKERHRT